MTRYEMMCAVIISAISVANAETEVMKIEMNDGSMQIVDIAKIKEITFDVKNDDGGDLQGHEAVDLGLFMPASGRKCDDPGYGGLSYCNDNGYYRIGDHIGKYTYFINFSSGDVDIDRDYDYRTLGFSVRAVTD